MAGVKGKSGRPPEMDRELKRIVMERAWFEIHSMLIDDKVPADEKRRYAIQLASRDIPQEVKSEVMMHANVEYKDVPDEEILNRVRGLRVVN